MTKANNQIIACPNCSAEQEVLLFDSVNVTIDPELKDQVLNNNINTYQCSNCKKAVSVIQNLLYNDMDNNILIYLLPEGKLNELAPVSALFGNLFAYRKMRAVRTMNQLREKIFILESGLNDYLIELLKAALITQLQPELQLEDPFAFAAGNLFFCEICENDSLDGQDLLSILLNTNRGTLHIRQPLELYSRMNEQLGGKINEGVYSLMQKY